jgi:hypothetical protein
MSSNRIEKLEKKSKARETEQGVTPPGTVEIAGYVADTVKGIRRLTKRTGRRDLAFLDYLLALAEQEAEGLASNVYH